MQTKTSSCEIPLCVIAQFIILPDTLIKDVVKPNPFYPLYFLYSNKITGIAQQCLRQPKGIEISMFPNILHDIFKNRKAAFNFVSFYTQL